MIDSNGFLIHTGLPQFVFKHLDEHLMAAKFSLMKSIDCLEVCSLDNLVCLYMCVCDLLAIKLKFSFSTKEEECCAIWPNLGIFMR